jgi:hypothetical protein
MAPTRVRGSACEGLEDPDGLAELRESDDDETSADHQTGLAAGGPVAVRLVEIHSHSSAIPALANVRHSAA